MSRNFEDCKQTTDYNCGPAAIAYMLRRHEANPPTVDEVTAAVRCTPEDGTSHDAIEDFLYDRGYTFSSGKPSFSTARLPMLCNYTVVNLDTGEEDGHYGVLINVYLSCSNQHGLLFDPAVGKIVTVGWGAFTRNWFSRRYGADWGLWNLAKRDSMAERRDRRKKLS